jgi:hypothetical protein
MNDFRRHMEASANVKLYVGELAYGDRPFEVTDAKHPLDFQWRTREELWHKENLLNLIISRFPANWKYGAYIDGDFVLTRHDWALEAIHMLQHHDWIQLFSNYIDLGYDHEPVAQMKSFARRYADGELTPPVLKSAYKGTPYGYGSRLASNELTIKGVGATGAAWGFRREAFDACGGLLDTCIVGSGDWHMAFGFVGEPDWHPQTTELTRCGRAYAESIKVWQKRAQVATQKNIGVVDCLGVHHYHGTKDQRGYGWRWKILRDNDFDPTKDIYRDSQGVYQLTPAKPKLRDDIRAYFRSRNEDR